MKKLIIFIYLLLLACDGNNGFDTFKYTVKNESGKNIIVRSFLSNNPNISPIITNLSIGEEITKSEVSRHNYSFAEFFGDGDSFRDSIVVKYENQKIDFFNSNDNNIRNPLNIDEYNTLTETFIFTVSDYQNAEDCNSDCD